MSIPNNSDILKLLDQLEFLCADDIESQGKEESDPRRFTFPREQPKAFLGKRLT